MYRYNLTLQIKLQQRRILDRPHHSLLSFAGAGAPNLHPGRIRHIYRSRYIYIYTHIYILTSQSKLQRKRTLDHLYRPSLLLQVQEHPIFIREGFDIYLYLSSYIYIYIYRYHQTSHIKLQQKRILDRPHLSPRFFPYGERERGRASERDVFIWILI